MSEQAIYKYQIPRRTPTNKAFTIHMPEDAHVLSAQVQGGHLCLWAQCNPELPKVPHKFLLACTGPILPEEAMEFVDTVQLSNELVVHVFQL
jgi:hypothetical protein